MGFIGQLRSKELTEGVVISPNCKKAKTTTQQAAHSIIIIVLLELFLVQRDSDSLERIV